MRSTRLYASTFGLLTAFTVLSACSKPLTCALEGCSSNESVSLASDYTSADAMAQTKSADEILHDKLKNLEAKTDKGEAKDNENKIIVDKKIGDILIRLGLSETAAKIHADTLSLHEKRLFILEAKSSEQAAHLAKLDLDLSAQMDRISLNEAELVRLENELNAQLAVLAAADQTNLDQLNANIAALNESLTTQIAGLSSEMAEKISGIVQKMCMLRQELLSNDAAVAEAAASQIAALQSKLDAEVATLSAADQANMDLTIQEISRLDGKVNQVIFASVLAAIHVQGQIADLKIAIKKLDAADKANLNFLKNKIASLNANLQSRLAQLEGVDQALVGRIVNLETATADLRTDHDLLVSAFEEFKAAQNTLNEKFVQDNSALAQDMETLKSDLNARIDAEVETLNGEMAEIISSSAAALSDAIAAVNAQIDSVRVALDAIGIELTNTKGDVAGLDARLTSLYGTVEALSTSYNAAVISVGADIASLRTLIATKSVCTISPKSNNIWERNFRKIDCDGVKITVLVKD